MTRSGSPDLNLLVSLEALLEERNLTHAGHRLNTSQPAMSETLARLRRHYDDELLHRVGRTYELTPFASRLLPQVRAAVAAARRFTGSVVDFDPTKSTRAFSVVSSDYALAVLVEPLLKCLAVVAPSIRVDFEPLPYQFGDTGHRVVDRDVMVAPVEIGVPGLHRILFSDRFVCIVDRNNPRLRDGRLNRQDLEELPHAVANIKDQMGEPRSRVLTELGLDCTIDVVCHSHLPLPFVVSGTDLLAFVPERLTRHCDPELNLVVADVPLPEITFIEAAHWHPHHLNDPGLRWLISLLVEVAGEL
ncbi:LysR family transcriptional regulator [Streptomyces sp. NPDC090088]|uniref:LysR family transcriptional regulator n=1 Tax=Streptomyces sp. NPDC090088 TaxID=3365944 RepID=UPI00380A3680